MKTIQAITCSVTALALAGTLVACGGAKSDVESAPAQQTTTESKQQATLQINTEGMGQIAWAYEGETPEFDDEYPHQSAVVNDAFGQTITIEAKSDPNVGDEWQFVKWTKDGKDFSTNAQIKVEVDGDAEYVAVFEAASE